MSNITEEEILKTEETEVEQEVSAPETNAKPTVKEKWANAKAKLGAKWNAYAERHPKVKKVVTYVNEHKTLMQAILFMVFSLLAFVSQLAIQAIFDAALKSVDQVVSIWPFEPQALGTFISFLIANIAAKVISFVMNRKKTFNANNNKIFSAVTYTIMVVVLIIVETIIGTPLGDALNNASNGVLGGWAYTLSMIMYSAADFVIVFLMDKFVIMRHKEEKTPEEEVSVEGEEDNESAPEEEVEACEESVQEEIEVLEEVAADQE